MKKPGKFIRTVRAIKSPDDDLRIEVTSIFACVPSVHLSISRHGVSETMFSTYELGEIAAALSEILYEVKAYQKI